MELKYMYRFMAISDKITDDFLERLSLQHHGQRECKIR